MLSKIKDGFYGLWPERHMDIPMAQLQHLTAAYQLTDSNFSVENLIIDESFYWRRFYWLDGSDGVRRRTLETPPQRIHCANPLFETVRHLSGTCIVDMT